jgi:hypothetical protein
VHNGNPWERRRPRRLYIADWHELKSINLSELEITGFSGWDSPFDGGSRFFFLESKKDPFCIVVANPNYWTEEDKREKRQVFYFTENGRFYRIEPKSKEEKMIRDALIRASKMLKGKGRNNPQLLMRLSELLENRKPIFAIEK